MYFVPCLLLVTYTYITLLSKVIIRMCIYWPGADASVVCRPKTTAETALHLACTAGDRDITQLLLASGARTDVCDADRALPLHKAAQYQNTGVAECLLQQR